ncbi:hypothetical protein PR048_000529 [Dryococelus australis]|uniref:Uncharacterized protein n=1 Tax=Dryococelus australis TaxID=614101 RepID=A0ABQ9IEW6_9NEOP|nr:hypothetical protein PR048_000529 [Dryococelus australis]
MHLKAKMVAWSGVASSSGPSRMVRGDVAFVADGCRGHRLLEEALYLYTKYDILAHLSSCREHRDREGRKECLLALLHECSGVGAQRVAGARIFKVRGDLGWRIGMTRDRGSAWTSGKKGKRMERRVDSLEEGSLERSQLEGGKPRDTAGAIHTKHTTSLSTTALLNTAQRNLRFFDRLRCGKTVRNYFTLGCRRESFATDKSSRPQRDVGIQGRRENPNHVATVTVFGKHSAEGAAELPSQGTDLPPRRGKWDGALPVQGQEARERYGRNQHAREIRVFAQKNYFTKNEPIHPTLNVELKVLEKHAAACTGVHDKLHDTKANSSTAVLHAAFGVACRSNGLPLLHTQVSPQWQPRQGKYPASHSKSEPVMETVHDKVSALEKNLSKKSLTLHPFNFNGRIEQGSARAIRTTLTRAPDVPSLLNAGAKLARSVLFSSCCVYLWDSELRSYHFIGGKSEAGPYNSFASFQPVYYDIQQCEKDVFSYVGGLGASIYNVNDVSKVFYLNAVHDKVKTFEINLDQSVASTRAHASVINLSPPPASRPCQRLDIPVPARRKVYSLVIYCETPERALQPNLDDVFSASIPRHKRPPPTLLNPVRACFAARSRSPANRGGIPVD